MLNAAYPTYTFIAFILVLVPLPWHLQSWNAGTCLYIIWTAVGCLIHFVNSILWAGNIEIHSMVYCDIATKILIGWSVGLPCAALCITRRLYLIATVSQVYTSRAEKRRAILIDVAIAVGFPIIIMTLHYIVQGHRFDIYEDYGCWPSIVNMIPSYFLVYIWPIVIGMASLIYSSLALYNFIRRRNEFNQYLSTNQSLVSANRYFRLMALAIINIGMVVPLAIYFMYLNLAFSVVSPWKSWSDTKFNFSRVDIIPAFEIELSPTLQLILDLNVWTVPSAGILFFIFFGMAEEARRNYKIVYLWVLKRCGAIPSIKQDPRVLPQNIILDRNSSIRPSENMNKWDELSIDLTYLEKRNSMSTVGRSYFGNGSPVSPNLPSIPAVHVTEADIEAQLSQPANTPLTSTQTKTLRPPSPTQTIERRGSDSTDLSIDVSPAYQYTSKQLPSFHEQALFNDVPPHNIPHGGVMVTIEKTSV